MPRSTTAVAIRPVGRPFLELDESLIYDLARIHCTNEEIASIVRCHQQTLVENYSQLLKDGRALGRSSLRRQQYKLAMEGNGTMLVWLGKQLLGQRDQADYRLANLDGTPLGATSVVQSSPLTVEDAERQYAALKDGREPESNT